MEFKNAFLNIWLMKLLTSYLRHEVERLTGIGTLAGAGFNINRVIRVAREILQDDLEIYKKKKIIFMNGMQSNAILSKLLNPTPFLLFVRNQSLVNFYYLPRWKSSWSHYPGL